MNGVYGAQEKTETRRKAEKRLRRDRLRPLRVVEPLESGGVFAKSPVEVKEGYVVSDRDTGELFVVLVFRNVAEKPLLSLDVRLLLFDEGMQTPYEKVARRYSWETATLGERSIHGQVRRERESRRTPEIEPGEEFGQGVFFPLPENYFHRMQVELVGVTYSVGGYEPLGLLYDPFDRHRAAKRFSDIDLSLRSSYHALNIFDRAEAEHPIRVLPQAGENAWLCCCGQKNPASAELCESCGRDKAWQLENLSEQHLREVEQARDPAVGRILHDTSAFPQNRYLESDREKAEKVRQCDEALQRLAAQERVRRRRSLMIIPKLGLLVLLAFLLWFVYELITTGALMGIFGGA